jgi:RNA polymerase sigma factor (sigma-70 family)
VDESELRTLFARGYPAIVSRVAASIRAHTDPEDLVQEALLRAWRRELDGQEADSLAAWVTTVAANVGRDSLRRDQVEERALGLLGGARDVASHDHLDLLAEAVEALPPRQRDIVLLHYYGDIDVDGVSRLLAIAPGTVKSALHHARRTLYEALAADTRVASRARRTDQGGVLKGWHMAGTHPGEYEHGVADAQLDGHRVAFIESKVDTASGFGTLMQTIDARRFLGQRIRLSGSARTLNVDGWVGLWLRVDGPHGRSTAFDNMQDRALKGSTEWARHQVVLDVATDSVAIAFGIILAGTGRAEVAHLLLEAVGTDVPTTGRIQPDAPVNMDFADH